MLHHARLDGVNPQAFSENASYTYTVNPGTYTISEDNAANYLELGCKLVVSDLPYDSSLEVTVSNADAVQVVCKNQQVQEPNEPGDGDGDNGGDGDGDNDGDGDDNDDDDNDEDNDDSTSTTGTTTPGGTGGFFFGEIAGISTETPESTSPEEPETPVETEEFGEVAGVSDSVCSDPWWWPLVFVAQGAAHLVVYKMISEKYLDKRKRFYGGNLANGLVFMYIFWKFFCPWWDVIVSALIGLGSLYLTKRRFRALEDKVSSRRVK